jgi:hypothetical protein
MNTRRKLSVEKTVQGPLFTKGLFLSAVSCLFSSLVLPVTAYCQHWFAFGSRLAGGGNDIAGIFGILLFVCPVVWILTRFYLNRLGSLLSGKSSKIFWIGFWRDSFGALGATVVTLALIAAVLLL